MNFPSVSVELLERSWSRMLAAFAVVVLPAGMAAANGGYFASSWGWAALGFGWLAAIGLIPRDARLALGCVGLAALAAFVAWTLISVVWASSPTEAVAQGERAFVVLVGVFAFLVHVRSRDLKSVLLAFILAAALICAYALATRLLPDALGGMDSFSGNRLTRPLGYWNSLGSYAAIVCAAATALLTGGGRVTRAAAGAVIPIFALTVYFTYSRGAIGALGVGLLVIYALNPVRVAWLSRVLFVGLVSAVGVLAASHETGLTTAGPVLGSTTSAGHKTALLLVGLSLLAGVAGLMPSNLLTMPARFEWFVAGAVAFAAVVAIIGALILADGPRAIVRKFEAPPPVTGGHLNRRLFSLSGSDRGALWSLAWHEYRANPVLGGGAGSYEGYYLRHRSTPGKVRNAHSLYLETLAELGPVGLALLLVALLAPLAAAVRARHNEFVPVLAGAYVVFLVHLAVDWDWQLTAVALTGMFCGAGILVSRYGDNERPLAPRTRSALLAAVVAGIALSFVVLVSNLFISESQTAARKGNWAASARDARRAQTWAPWSADPWRLLGEAQLGLGDRHAASASFRRAISKSPQDWSLWFDLARSTLGSDQRTALAHASRLNPLSPEIAELRRELQTQPVIDVTSNGSRASG